MNHKTMGMIFICISAFLYGTRYIASAIFGSNVSSWNKEMYEAMLSYVGRGPLILSIISLTIGILCFMGPTIRRWHEQDLRKIKSNWREFDQPNDKRRVQKIKR